MRFRKPHTFHITPMPAAENIERPRYRRGCTHACRFVISAERSSFGSSAVFYCQVRRGSHRITPATMGGIGTQRRAFLCVLTLLLGLEIGIPVGRAELVLQKVPPL